MATLADLQPGQQFLFACAVTAVDQVTGLSLALFGPGRVQAATAVIAPGGVMSGQLAAPPNQVPVHVVTGFAPVGAGDVLQNNQTGETMVCRASAIGADGTVTWWASPARQVAYTAAGWSVVGHVNL